MKKALIIGSGAGGATVAKELQGKFSVTILEAGKEFHPFQWNLSYFDTLKKFGLMYDEREIQILFPAMKVRKTKDSTVMVNGNGLGGTTTLATGNALRVDEDLKELGINLDNEFEELYKEIPISTDHQKRWRTTTRQLFNICQEMNFNPMPLPKMGDNRKCTRCGRCVLGCAQGAKWDTRNFLHLAEKNGASILTGHKVEKLIIENNHAIGVKVRKGCQTQILIADLIVLSAGGFGTPVILENSGITCERKLFVDHVLCVATEWKNAYLNQEISMPFVVQRNGYILSPYFDYLSYFFNKTWSLPAKDTLAIMIKIADSNFGDVLGRTINKTLSLEDKEKLNAGVNECLQIMAHLGINRKKTFLGTVNAGHPGGMLPLTKDDAETLHPHRLPDNVFVADASLFPKSLGNPPILTIMALAKRVSKICAQMIV